MEQVCNNKVAGYCVFSICLCSGVFIALHIFNAQAVDIVNVIGSLGAVMMNLCTKFEVSNFSQYEDINGNAECTKRMVWVFWVSEGHQQYHH